MDRWEPYALPGIIALAAVVRFATLDGQSFDHDEAVTAARVLHPSLFDTLSAVVHGERSPPSIRSGLGLVDGLRDRRGRFGRCRPCSAP